jgi:molecular chaperone DnaK (HSP70)
LADLKRRHKVTLDKKKDGRALRRLWQACDNAKRALSGTESVTVEVDGLAGDVDYELKLSR